MTIPAKEAHVTAVHAPGTELAAYAAGGQAEEYRARLVMTPEDAKALDDQIRACTRAVLREGTDYGIIPGTSGDKVLYKPGAEKLLQWFGLAFANDRQEIERDDEGRREGVTYRATILRRLPDGTRDVVATCEGYAGYDEDAFCQPEEKVRAKAEAKERMWAKKDRRVADPVKWQNLGEYRAPWNSVIKRAQKRALVGAVIDATAAAGLFKQDEDDGPAGHAQQDDSPTYYQQALAAAVTFTDEKTGRQMDVEVSHAARDGLCTPGQATHIQNRIQQRIRQLKTATPVDAEDLAATAGTMDADAPGTVIGAQLTKLHTVLTGLGFGAGDREQKLQLAELIGGRAPLHGPFPGRTSKNLSLNEARKLIDTLEGFDGRAAADVYMAGREQAGDE